MRGKKRAAVSTVWLWAAAAAASGGCAQILGVDWSNYTQGEGTGGVGGAGGARASGGVGAGGGAGGAQSGGTAAGGSIETGGAAGAGGAECSADEGKCLENTPQRCVDGRWESGEACVGRTCVDGTCTGECGPDELRCSENRPQRCDERGEWIDEEPCPKGAPVCSGGTCVTPPSCADLAPTCGPESNESCCATTAVPGGPFNRSNDESYPATVSGFLLDRFEVTVGRFRRFVGSYPGSRPAAGAGAHPKIDRSGWDAGWDDELPVDATALKAAVECESTRTWTDEVADHEHLPMNCLNWYEAFAFCAWDGGRLPTEAEWNYAAAGGNQQRPYPWSNSISDQEINGSHAVYDCMADGVMPRSCAFNDILPVGSKSPTGNGRWGQADLAGNIWEWALDSFVDYQLPCNDCATLRGVLDGVIRGGGWSSGVLSLLSYERNDYVQSDHGPGIGVRCARTP
ncbi:formylglycine-generating enzyme family protein [Sorangium sp. So ce1182]|uniref:formylglycine-generating enzyme family protein n=1 Tax=Sorangium sp. So ce1182 TaxID=3133334 RepID=UPI003F5F89E3